MSQLDYQSSGSTLNCMVDPAYMASERQTRLATIREEARRYTPYIISPTGRIVIVVDDGSWGDHDRHAA
jgi:predicted phosphoribosyltransferase